MQSPLREEYAPYERDFVVVQWDPRGSGLLTHPQEFLDALAATLADVVGLSPRQE
ncbi:MAG TPA: hypothetical protein VIN61_18565 [Gammaproteobacteria bacterium]